MFSINEFCQVGPGRFKLIYFTLNLSNDALERITRINLEKKLRFSDSSGKISLVLNY